MEFQSRYFHKAPLVLDLRPLMWRFVADQSGLYGAFIFEAMTKFGASEEKPLEKKVLTGFKAAMARERADCGERRRIAEMRKE